MNKSVWSIESDLPKFKTQECDLKTDVLIIGGGIAGILTAYFLEQSGVNYVLVEKEKICSGVTKNTTAKITYQHGLIYDKILKSYGKEIAYKYLKANFNAFDKYKGLCKNIDCDYEIKDNYVYSINDRQKIESEISALSKIGYRAEFCQSVEIPVNTVGAVKFPNQAQFNPLEFLSEICKGLNIYEDTFVRQMIGNTALTNKGKIFAKSVVCATHFPFINKHGSYFLKLYQHRSYVIALKNEQKLNGMYVDESGSGLSFRNYNDLLLLGGAGHRTGENKGCWRELRQFASKTYTDSKEKYYWATQDCMSLDSIPYIGNYSKNTPNFYVLTGFNKWGITSSMAGAMIINDLIIKGKSEYSDVFNPSRNILKPQLFVNGFETTKNLLSFSNKRCPHLGCALKWNKAEHTWDCQCHGSRFDNNGKVLDNPANGNLKLK